MPHLNRVPNATVVLDINSCAPLEPDVVLLRQNFYLPNGARQKLKEPT